MNDDVTTADASYVFTAGAWPEVTAGDVSTVTTNFWPRKCRHCGQAECSSGSGDYRDGVCLDPVCVEAEKARVALVNSEL